MESDIKKDPNQPQTGGSIIDQIGFVKKTRSQVANPTQIPAQQQAQLEREANNEG